MTIIRVCHSYRGTYIAIHSFIHLFIEPLGDYDDHDWAVIIVFLTYTYSLLIEISTNATRIQLTDVHQMRVIHSNSESDYTSHHYILSFLLVDLPYSIMPHAQAYAHIYEYL
jgi:hypothetical protein